LLGFDVLGPRFEPWVVMVMPPGGFLMLGIIFLWMGWQMERKRARTPAVVA
jgi:electron transport complex protein RnfE